MMGNLGETIGTDSTWTSGATDDVVDEIDEVEEWNELRDVEVLKKDNLHAVHVHSVRPIHFR